MEFKATELIALGFSTIALFFTFRKDAHRVSLEVTPLWEQWIDVLGVSNDSSFSVGVLSVGHFNLQGHVTWLPVGSFVENRSVKYPIRIETRSLCSLQVLVVNHIGNHKAPHGYCVQLESGRVYVIQHTAPVLPTLKLRLASLASRLSAGRFVPWLVLPRLPGQQ